MLGNTRPITILMQLSNFSDGVTGRGNLTLDRTQFGMTGSLDGVSKSVAISIVVGQSTTQKVTPRQAAK